MRILEPKPRTTCPPDPQQARRVWSELKRIPDANGNAQGVTLGSLETRAERLREEMKPTAASLQQQRLV
eukprot:scaffold9829_cov26-Tisochrysis_lutea.AAC.1